MFKTQAEFYESVEDSMDCLGNDELCQYLSDFLWQTGRNFYEVAFTTRDSIECEFYDFLRDCVTEKVLMEYNLTQKDIDDLPEEEEA